jgi:nucleoside-diphosphate-sugar epimerase
MLAMERARAGSVFNVGGGQEATMNETIALLEGISGRSLEVERAEAVAGDQRRTKADTTRIHDELGWQPTTSLEDGLRAQWEWAAVESRA